MQRAVNMRARFDMCGQDIGPGICKGIDIGIHRRDHQMHVHYGRDMLAKRLYGRGAKGKVGDKMPIHHIDMHPIGALGFDRLNLCPEIRKIG